MISAILSDNKGARNAERLLSRLTESGSTWEKYDGTDYEGAQVIYAGGYVTHSLLGASEVGIVYKLRELAGDVKIDETRLIKACRGRRIAESQLTQLIAMLSSKVGYLTGGPGTGKTTCMDVICAYFQGFDLLLVSPTAMGAKRIQQCTGLPASTVHRALGYKRGHFEKNENNPLSAEVVICDEATMLGTTTAWSLIKALKPGTLFYVIGDVNQLPSVDPGALFRDICETLPGGRLTEVFRTDADGPIGLGCKDILNGDSLQDYINNNSEFRLVDCEIRGGITKAEISSEVDKSCAALGIKPHEVRICTPTNERCEYINNFMQVKYPEVIPMIQRRNDYKLGANGIFNGSVGTLQPDRNSVDFDGEIVRLTNSMELGFCVTIHCLQGSEAESIIVVIPRKGANRLHRGLVYTAGTRGKKRVVFIGDMDSLNHAIAKEQPRRITMFPKLYRGTVQAQ